MRIVMSSVRSLRSTDPSPAKTSEVVAVRKSPVERMPSLILKVAERAFGVFESGAAVAEHAADDGAQRAEDRNREQLGFLQREESLAVHRLHLAVGQGKLDAAGDLAAALHLETIGGGQRGNREFGPAHLADEPAVAGEVETRGHRAVERIELEVLDP